MSITAKLQVLIAQEMADLEVEAYKEKQTREDRKRFDTAAMQHSDRAAIWSRFSDLMVDAAKMESLADVAKRQEQERIQAEIAKLYAGILNTVTATSIGSSTAIASTTAAVKPVKSSYLEVEDGDKYSSDWLL